MWQIIRQTPPQYVHSLSCYQQTENENDCLWAQHWHFVWSQSCRTAVGHHKSAGLVSARFVLELCTDREQTWHLNTNRTEHLHHKVKTEKSCWFWVNLNLRNFSYRRVCWVICQCNSYMLAVRWCYFTFSVSLQFPVSSVWWKAPSASTHTDSEL